MRRKRYSKKKFYISVIIGLLISISIGYSFLTSTLSINGNITVSKNSWDVHFENIVINESSSYPDVVPVLSDNNTNLLLSISLREPGDFYEFSVDIVNTGSIDAMLSDIVKTSLTEEQKKFLSYSVTYIDGGEFKNNDLLSANSRDTIRVNLNYIDGLDESIYPSSDQSIVIKLETNYVQAENTAKLRDKKLCVKALTRHKEECTNTEEHVGCFPAGYSVDGSKGTTTISYGNLGTKGTLATGDSFDCDVNGDGIYDSASERFYYVTDLDANENYATLLYYNNVKNKVMYNYDYGEYRGPDVASLELPRVGLWTNVTLYNTRRTITDTFGNIKVTDYNYDGFASRFPTVQEIAKACDINVQNVSKYYYEKCEFLNENTKYSSSSVEASGFWLENVYSELTTHAHAISHLGESQLGYIVQTSVKNNGDFGVRPVIEVSKDNMYY